MANIGYIQVVRHCNHHCRICSNPKTSHTRNLEALKALVDDLVKRDYYGVILTGGEPTLDDRLPKLCAYARAQGLHVRMITNGSRGHDRAFVRELAQAGLQLAHVSIYSTRVDVERALRGVDGTLDGAHAMIDACHDAGIDVNVNTVINRLNADHLDTTVRELHDHHPHIRHFVWNNLDPSMGRAEQTSAELTPRLADFELSLLRALSFLHRRGLTFRVEKVPLCYMTEFAWASTETRKIVKSEERVVHFLDDKGTVRQTDWDHLYAPDCQHCTLHAICGGLFDRGRGYDPAELYPVFVNLEAVVEAILRDPADPSRLPESLANWRRRFAATHQTESV